MAYRFIWLSILSLSANLASVAPILAASLERATPEDVGFSSARLERLDRALQSYIDDHELAGTVTLVARNDKILYLKAFGQSDREATSPMREDSIFRIASQTKAIVSVGIMTLVEEGSLLLTDSVGNFIPEFFDTTVAVPLEVGSYDIVPASRPITIRDLLTHTSGIGYGYGLGADAWEAAGIQGWYFADRTEPIGETVVRMASLPAEAQPGERWVYGYNIDILGALAERVSGQSLDEFLSERILIPLGMSDTHFYLPPSKKDRLAVVYSEQSGELVRASDPGDGVGQGHYLDGPRTSFSGGAGLLSTATDYARFLQMLLNGGELDGIRILSPKTVELMTTNHVGDLQRRPGEGFGLGFSVLEDLGARGFHGSEGEYRWGGAYHSMYWVDPAEDLLVVHLTQLIPAGDVDDQAKVRALIYQAIVN
ncbi:MAG: serine hydrolase domain-containing protein [Gammaproteobacteria bacterium]